MWKLGDFFKKSKNNKHLKYLKENIVAGMPLADIVTVFEQMCQMPSEGSMLLFETGTFSFDTRMFHFSLVRQYPGKGEEYYQLHIDIMYEPTDENAVFSKSIWDIDLEENIFDYIRSSPAYFWANENPICKIDIFMDET
ncbi:MAG: hypothetical protein E7429_04935 [Ruminococcaceae bacterium]|nr:hypothetical protein [Oscillospiraceae bacterium]